MSYASRLVRMTGRAAPSVRPLAPEVVETQQVDAPVERATPAAQQPLEVREPRSTPTVPTNEPASQVIMRESTREITRVVEPRTASSQRPLAPAPARASAHREPGEDWRREREDGADPLQTIAAGDEMRELLRAVRAWTSSAPTRVEQPPAEPASIVEIQDVAQPTTATTEAAQSAPAASRADDPVEVSIGNVTITIEDAPASGRARAQSGSPNLDTASRLARHYWRGE